MQIRGTVHKSSNFGVFHIQFNPQFFELLNTPLGVVGLSRRAVISSDYLKVPSSILGAETFFLFVRSFADNYNLFFGGCGVREFGWLAGLGGAWTNENLFLCRGDDSIEWTVSTLQLLVMCF